MLKGHLLLRQAHLANDDRTVVISASSGSYEVNYVSAAFQNIFRNRRTTETSMQRATTDGYYQQTEETLQNPAIYQPSEAMLRSHEQLEEGEPLCGLLHRGRGVISHGMRRRNYGNRDNEQPPNRRYEIPTFYTFNTSDTNDVTRPVVDSGACASVVGKKTLG